MKERKDDIKRELRLWEQNYETIEKALKPKHPSLLYISQCTDTVRHLLHTIVMGHVPYVNGDGSTIRHTRNGFSPSPPSEFDVDPNGSSFTSSSSGLKDKSVQCGNGCVSL